MRARFSLLMAALLFVPAAVRADDTKTQPPTVIVRLASLDQLTKDARYLATLAGRAEEAKQAEGFLKSLAGEKGLEGIATNKPVGLYGTVGPNGVDSRVVLMIPVADQQAFLELLKRQNVKPEKDKDDVYSFEVERSPFPVMFRFANGYAYATMGLKESIDKDKILAPDKVLPAGKIGTLSATVNLVSLPEETRTMILGQLELQLGNLTEKRPGETEAQHAFRKKVIDEAAGLIKSLLEDKGTLALGLAVDQKADELAMSISLSAAPGSEAAKTIQALSAAKSRVAGVVGQDSAMSFVMSLALPEDLQKSLTPALQDVFDQVLKARNDPPAKELLSKLFKAVTPTVKQGKFDTAADFRGPNDKGHYTAVIGAAIQEGSEIEAVIKEAVGKLPRAERKVITLNADKVGDVSIHRLNVEKELDAQAREAFGENPMYFAVSNDALFVAMGANGLEALKGALKVEPAAAPLMRVRMAMARMAPLMAREHKSAPEAAKKAFEQGKDDKFTVTLEAGKELKLRIEMKGPVIRFFSLLEQAERNTDS